MLLPLGFPFVCWPPTLSDIPKGLSANLTRRLALNSQARGFTTWRAKMPASGAEMHPQIEIRSNNMAAVDMQAMEEELIALFSGKNLELKICSRIRRPQARHM